MVSYSPPKKNAALILYRSLPSVGTANVYQANPTIAAGDFKVSIDGGAFANLATLPTVTPASGKMVKISLSAAEMNGDNIAIVCSDAAGGEWKDITISIHTSARQIDDLAYPSTTGRSINVSATGLVDADTVAISNDTTAADNLESQYDTTGLTGDTFPSSQAQLGAITNVSSAVNKPASSYTLTTGTQSANTVASTEALDGTNHEHTDDAGAMDLYYEFIVGAGTPSSVTVTGYLNGNNDDLEVHGYDWITSSWKQIGILAGKATSSNEVNNYVLFVNMVGTGVNLGKVRVRFTDGAFTLTSATLAIDQIFVVFSQASDGYDNGAIWVDTNASNTNTIVGVDGTASNPVSTWAAALTLSAATNLIRFHITGGSSITLTGNSDSYEIVGQGYTLALGGQSVAAAYIFGATVTGIGTGALPVFEDCPIGNVTLPPSVMRRCFLSGTITNSGAGDWFINHCMSRVAGTSSPVFDFGTAVANTNLNMRLYSGGIQLESMGDTGTDAASIEGNGQIIEGTCTGGTVAVRGNFTTSGITNITLSDDARYDTQQIADSVWDEMLTGATHNVANSSGKRLRNISGTAEIDSQVNDPGATATTTVFNTNLTEADDWFNDSVLVFTNGSSLAGQARPILDYKNANGEITLDEGLTIAPVDTDDFVILANHIHPISQIAKGVWDETITQPGQATPSASGAARSLIGYIFKAWRNKSTQTATEYNLYNDDTTTVDQKSTTNDDGSTFTKNETTTGP